MKLSVSVTNYSWPDEIHHRLASLAGYLDDTAVDTLWVADHLLQADPASRLDEPMLEAYTTLGYLAAATSRIRLGTMVTAATFRAPALLIKAVTTLDVLSAGRTWLGIGAGYNGDEASAMGLFLPDTAERFARMTELLRLARQMWSGDESPFRGEYLDLEHPVGSPRPVTTPGPPVLIGGTGVRRRVQSVRRARRRHRDPQAARRAGSSLRRRRPAARGDRADGDHGTPGRRELREAGRALRRIR
jgi:alkanesulfonate monooxygenase SsuD/methylene tetrahydromethanopterin reductase-like flavin-dependent oxidoreductase (luciferase family)